MSADAKMWNDDNGDWHGIHDGECLRELGHHGNAYMFQEIVDDMAECMKPAPITRWVLHVYPDGKAGLRGFTW